MSCVFCEIIAGRAPATILAETPTSVVIVPLGPVTPGHVLIIPRIHVVHFATDLLVSTQVMADAAIWAQDHPGEFNILTSAGRAATQSVDHLHVHYVPRAADDGLMLPWGTLHGENPQDPHRCRGIVALTREIEQCVCPHLPPETLL